MTSIKALIASAAVLVAPLAHGAIAVNWVFSSTSITMTLQGTATADSAPSFSANSLIITDLGNPNWIDNATADGNPTGTIDGLSANGSGGSSDTTQDYLLVSTSSPIDLTDGGAVDVTASWTGSFVPGEVTAGDLTVHWGSNGVSPYPSADTALATVPEPSTYAGIAGLLALGVAIWRRRRG